MWFIGVEVEQETSAPPPKKNPGSAPVQSGFRPKMSTREGIVNLRTICERALEVGKEVHMFH